MDPIVLGSDGLPDMSLIAGLGVANLNFVSSDLFSIAINTIKIVIIFLMMIQAVPVLVWVERRGSAFIQHRFGPNRVGPLGLTQLLADAVKFIFKEEFSPERSVRFIYYMAPVVALIPAALALAAIPLSIPIVVQSFDWLGRSWGPYYFEMQGFRVPIGIVFVLAASSLGAYSLMLAGWGSNNKYSLMGAMRACAQMVSYELSLGLSLGGIILIFGAIDFGEIIAAQMTPLKFQLFGFKIELFKFLPNWGIFYQPLGAFLYLVTAFAESNRLPFDLAEAEGELVAGFHTEYGGFKLLLFFMGEYGHMIVASGVFVIFFLGGYAIPWVSPDQAIQHLGSMFSSATAVSVVASLIFFVVFLLKIIFFLWLFIWVRWTFPRFRYDRLMSLGWKTLLPLALVNLIVTATIMFFSR